MKTAPIGKTQAQPLLASSDARSKEPSEAKMNIINVREKELAMTPHISRFFS